LFQRRKWRTSLRTGYTSNVSALVLSRVLGELAGAGSVAPDTAVFLPFRNRISNLNVNALTSVSLPRGLGLYGSADRNSVFAPGQSGLSSTYYTAAAGVTYTGAFRWLNVSGQYGRDLGRGA